MTKRGAHQPDDTPATVTDLAAALAALGHSILVIVYHVLTRREPYHEPGGNYFDERQRQSIEHRLIRRLELLGYAVTLQPTAA